ncbi:hypothetical protein B0H10DRAFT_1961170 [Mycena sp. CBHHK59/15]|nr:hypothetical protein B0H10DRAFT_1961170 [Mycena sp. CBHHK59/15]
MYVLHKHRGQDNTTYGPFDYEGEFSDFLTQLAASPAGAGRAKNILIAPNIANFAWKPEDVWNTGMVDTYHDNLAFLAVEKYPADNCGAMFGAGDVVEPQSVLANYLTHDAHRDLLQQYLNSTAYAQKVNKPFLMFETNTASCGGFNGISDSFTAALWGLDYGLQMAYSNFSGAMFHLGGQNVFYNPFTSPPTNQSTFHQWSVGPLYYSALVMAEAIGPSNKTQVLDIGVAGTSSYTPIYGLYEDGVPVRVAIFNYVDDPSGATNVSAVISIAGAGATPASVKVKYLLADSVVQKGGYTWAGQTFGGNFASDGRPMGDEDVKTVQCDTGAQTCTVVVPAPGFALVFLSDSALTESAGAATATFPTTAHTKTHNTATVDPSVLSTSNGNRASEHELAGTSKPPKSGALAAVPPLAMAVGAALVLLGRGL